MNQEGNASGMGVVAAVRGSLVITELKADENVLDAIGRLTENWNKTEVNFIENEENYSYVKLFDCTHIDSEEWTGVEENTTYYPSGLRTLTSASRKDISATSGKEKNNSVTLNYMPANNTEDEIYYIDYVVFLASQGVALEDQIIKLTLTADETDAVYADATAVDVFVMDNANNAQEAGEAYYVNSYNLGSFEDAVTIAGNGESGITIPKADGVSGVKVVLRVYLDGAALSGESEESPAVLNSDSYNANIDENENNIDNLTKFSVTFEVDDKQQA